MLTRFARLPLRRCLHSRAIPKPQSHRRTIAFGVSAAATTYLTWRLASDDYRIALDSPQAGHISGSETASPTSATSEGASLKAGTSSSSSPEGVASALPSASTGGDFGPESTSTLEEGQENPSESNENGSNGGAFNPETGEINWDCPCLGGMAYGPCGPQFREAFSCFVYSEAEPKGMDCVEKFKAMQDCFRAHPDVYADEIGDDEEESLSTSGGEPSNVTDIEDDKLLPIQAQAEISSNDTPGSPSSTASS